MGRVSRGPRKSTNVRDIARRAGVSIASVSRVLNEHPDVSADVRERVQAVLAEVNYPVKPAAPERTMMLGLLIGRLSSSYSGEVLRGVCGAAEEHGYNVVLYTMGDTVSQEERSVAALLDGQIDGLLLVLPSNMRHHLERLSSEQRPFVVIDHRELEPWGPTIGCTDRKGAYDGTQYLLSLGHQRTAVITGPHDWGVTVDRLAGHQEALADRGMETDPALIIEGSFSQRSGFAALGELLNRAPDLTAVFALNDAMAIGALDALKAAGRRVPEDVSVLGFGDSPAAAAAHPALTTVHQPTLEMSRYAVSYIMRQIAGLPLPRERLDLPTMLVQRGSCALTAALSAHLTPVIIRPFDAGVEAGDGTQANADGESHRTEGGLVPRTEARMRVSKLANQERAARRARRGSTIWVFDMPMPWRRE